MRILHVIESLEAGPASASLSLVGLVKTLRARGMEAAVKAERIGGAEQLGFDPTWHWTSPDGQADAGLAAFDVVHLHGWHPQAQQYLGEAARAKTPCVLSPLGQIDPADFTSWTRRFGLRFGLRRRLRSAALLTAMNEWEEDRLRQVAPAAHVELLPLGMPIQTIAAAMDEVARMPGVPPDRYILVLGPIDPASGAVALLKALAEIGPDADGWRVVFAGGLERHWQQALEAAVFRKGGADRVRFVNDPAPAAQWAWLAACGMLVSPALRSRPPMTMMWAITAGIPACATVCAAPAGIECTTCAPSRAALREMVAGMLRRGDAGRRDTAARLAETAKRQLDWSVLVDRYVELYRSLARR